MLTFKTSNSLTGGSTSSNPEELFSTKANMMNIVFECYFSVPSGTKGR